MHLYLAQRNVYEASNTLAVLLRMWHCTVEGKYVLEGLFLRTDCMQGCINSIALGTNSSCFLTA